MVGSDSSEKIAATVEVEDEKISGEATVDAVVAETNVGIEGDRVGDIFVILDVLLRVEFLGRTVGRLIAPGNDFDGNLAVSFRVFGYIHGS